MQENAMMEAENKIASTLRSEADGSMSNEFFFRVKEV